MNFSFFIAHKLYKDKGGRQHVSRPAITIATAGVAIGLVVMLLSVFVVLGFKHTIRDKVIGFGSHIQVTNFMTQMSSDQAPIAMNDSMMKVVGGIEGVKHVERFAYKQGILKTDSDFLGVMFEGVAQEYDTTFIHQNMVAGSIPKFSDSQSGNHILISRNIADKLKVNAGDRIFAYFIDENGVRMRRFTIQGIYQTNLSQYDQVMCFTDLYTTVKLNAWQPDQVSGAAITVNDFKQLDEVESRFVEKINRTEDRYGETYATQTIRDINPQIFSWLDLLDMNVWIILVLMVSVAGVTMISGLLIIILERTTMIGVLKALGTRNKTIRHIFLWFAAFIIGRALLIGNAIALGMALLQQWTGIIKLDPATYYVSTVPVEINIPLLIILNVATLLISLFVLIAPSYLISHIHPAKSMRYE
ncbi:FtsX-like permease family protein [Hallella sp.]|uniref:ABC transporter permease n=1 Tax=Hallella sp. TaxID=2980186 RepID=UPI00307A055B